MNYEPGTVAMVLCSDGKERIAIAGRRFLDDGIAWVFSDGQRRDAETSQARQLVVLDLKNPEDTARQLRATGQSHLRWLAKKIEQQTKPPKPEEPKGAGAVITARRPAACQARLIRTDVPSPRRWVDPDGDYYLYSELDGVIIRSEGWGVVND